MKRTIWIDATRFFAMVMVMLYHFIDKTNPDAFSVIYEPPGSYFLSGLYGKIFVIYFCVLLGYFASKPRRFSFKSLSRYFAQRYFQFAFYVFIISAVYIASSYVSVWIFHAPDEDAFKVICDTFSDNAAFLLRNAFLFESNYITSYWCIRPLIIASLLCWFLGCLPEDSSLILRLGLAVASIVILLLIYPQTMVFAANAVLGYIVRLFLEAAERFPKLKTKSALICMAVLSLCLIRIPLPECPTTHFLEGIACSLVFFIFINFPAFQRLLSRDSLAWLGRMSFGMFMAETPVNSILHSTFYPLLHGHMPEALLLPVYFIFHVAVTVLVAWLLDMLFNRARKALFKERSVAAV